MRGRGGGDSGWWWRAGVLAAIGVLVAYALVVLIPAARRPDTNGFAVYYTVSRVLLDHGADLPRIYDNAWFQAQIDAVGFHRVQDEFYAQPPTLALLMAPLAWMTPAAVRVAWTACAATFWVAGVALLCRALVGRAATARVVLVTVAATAAYRPLRENFDRGQAYTLLFLLLVGTTWLLARGGRRAAWAAGVPLGLMLVLKTAGAWLVVMLVLSRRFRPVVAASATYVAVALVASPWIHPLAWEHFFALVRGLAGDPVRCVSAYQSVNGMLGHLFVHDATYCLHPLVEAPRVAMVASLLVFAAVALQTLRVSRRGGDSRGAGLLRVGLFDALLVTMSPIAEGYHYVLVLPAVIIAAWWALEARAGLASRAVLGVALVLLTAPQSYYSHPAIQAGALALLAYPRIYGAFLLWGWLGGALTTLPGTVTVTESASVSPSESGRPRQARTSSV